MILMIFAHNVVRYPGEDHFWPRNSNQSHNFLQRLPMSPRFQRVKNIASWRVGAMQKPCMRDSVRGKRVTSFHLANVGQGFGLLRSGSISARISPRGVDDGYSLVLLLNQLCYVRGELDVVIRMTIHLQNIHFVTLIGRG